VLAKLAEASFNSHANPIRFFPQPVSYCGAERPEKPRFYGLKSFAFVTMPRHPIDGIKGAKPRLPIDGKPANKAEVQRLSREYLVSRRKISKGEIGKVPELFNEAGQHEPASRSSPRGFISSGAFQRVKKT
jgi:hypothetical protein